MGVWIETARLTTTMKNTSRHTLRGCVDWNSWCSSLSVASCVTPFVGVWIETLLFTPRFFLMVSHPSWVCGLKLLRPCPSWHRWWVTPFVGVWIETCPSTISRVISKVTPFVGVWIETIRLSWCYYLCGVSCKIYSGYMFPSLSANSVVSFG